MKEKKSKPRTQFQIKLMAGNNIVSVECAGYESEVFIPQIINGRIGLVNIIPNRRCCMASMKISNNSIESRSLTSRDNKMWRPARRTEYPQTNRNSPASPNTFDRSKGGKENYFQSRKNQASSSSSITSSGTSESIGYAGTPEMPRFQRMPGEGIPTPEAVLRNVCNLMKSPKYTSRNTQQSRAVLVSSTPHASPCFSPIAPHTESPRQRISKNRTCENEEIFDIPLPKTPEQLNRRTNLSEHVAKAIPKRLQSGRQAEMAAATETATTTSTTLSPKWRKCLTPIRTYSRNRVAVSSSENIQKTPLPPQPPKRVQPTQGIKSHQTTKVLKRRKKKRKLIIDEKKTISPCTVADVQKPNLEELRTINREKLTTTLPKTRRQLQYSQDTAFDKLTNPVRPQSAQLQEQFRGGCINKMSTTLPKYKALIKIEPLQPISAENYATKVNRH